MMLGQAAEHAEAPRPAGQRTSRQGGIVGGAGRRSRKEPYVTRGGLLSPSSKAGSRDPETTIAAGWASRGAGPNGAGTGPGPAFGAAGALVTEPPGSPGGEEESERP